MTPRAQKIEKVIRDYLRQEGMPVDRDGFSGEVSIREYVTSVRKVSLTKLACLVDEELADRAAAEATP
jgi:hypothetical protein